MLNKCKKGERMPETPESSEAAACCESNSANSAFRGASCCRVDALITIDGRGQILLPKDIRARAGIEGKIVFFEGDIDQVEQLLK